MKKYAHPRYKLKITILKRISPYEIFGDTLPVTYLNEPIACWKFKDGQEFIVGNKTRRPEGFCQSAWGSIQNRVMLLAFGGNYPWNKEKGVCITCCSDGLKPVIFKIERLDKVSEPDSKRPTI